MNICTKFLVLFGAALFSATANSQAEQTNALGGSDSLGNTSWNTAGNWTNQVPPGPGTNYFTLGNTMRTPPVTGNQTFLGDSLNVGPGGNVNYKGTSTAYPGDVITANWIMNGGIINNSVGTDYPVIAGNMNVVANSAFSPGCLGRLLIISATLSGSALLTNGCTFTGTIIYTNDNATAFTGPMLVNTNSTLMAGSQTNIGGNPGSFNAAQLVLDSGIFQPAASMSLSNANSGVTLNPGGGAFNVGSGLTLVISNPITGPGNLTNSGAGSLVLAGTNTYSGSTTLSAGTLQLQNATALPSSAVSMSSGTTLQLRSDNGATFAPSSFGFPGASGTVTYNFDVNDLTAGNTGKTLVLANVGQFGPGGTTDNFNLTGGNGYTLRLGSGASGTGALSDYNNTTLNANTAGVTLSIPGGISINYASSYTLALGGVGNFSLGPLTRSSTYNLTPTFGGSGTIALNGANNFGAATATVSSTGTLTLNNAGALNGISTLKSRGRSRSTTLAGVPSRSPATRRRLGAPISPLARSIPRAP